tara:strand:+ start:24 stop:779 length:756 start_codon:yes stop_codon:yes gene_type:complete
MIWSLSAPDHPSPQEWLRSTDIDSLSDQISFILPLLIQTATLTPVLEYWIRREISNSYKLTKKQQLEINSLHDDWSKGMEQRKFEDKMPIKSRKEKIAVNFACMAWARDEWGHMIESIYLENKSFMDTVKCNLLRVESKNLALELYHQIKNDEITFADASRQFGIGSESKKLGELPIQPIKSLPYGLEKIVGKLTPGTLSMPTRLGENFAIIYLAAKSDTRLDTSTENQILQNLLDSWIHTVASLVSRQLC